MKIYIPSYKRSEVKTLKYLPPHWLRRTFVVVEERDKDRLQNLPPGVTKLVCPKSTHIGQTRQWVLDNTPETEILFLDDDITIQAKVAWNKWNLREATYTDFEHFIARARAFLGLGYPLVGASARNEAHLDYAKDTQENARILRWLAIDIGFARQHDIRFDRVPTSEDYDFHLQILRMGVCTLKDCRVYVGDGGSNRPGEGCFETHSQYADGESQKIIQSFHPQFIKLVTKTGSGWVRTDVRVQWKKAYEEGVRKCKTKNT